MVAKVLQLNKEQTIFWTLSMTFMLCIGFYMYFVNTTIHNTVVLEVLENEASNLTLSIGNKEFQYITMRNAITLPLAHSLGFKEVFVKTFVSKKSSNQVSYLQL